MLLFKYLQKCFAFYNSKFNGIKNLRESDIWDNFISLINLKIYNLTLFFIMNLRRCYDNSDIKPKSGSITRFNDGVFNGNVTITPKDSVGINNPVLINELDSGLYNIKKDYYDGTIEENVIYKEN